MYVLNARNIYSRCLYLSALTKYLTPWSRVLLEKLRVTQLVKKYGIRMFIFVFTRARHWSLS